MLFIKVLFILSGFLIFWGMIGYQLTILMLDKIVRPPKKVITNENLDIHPTISIIIVAHNEEKVILDKLKNVSNIEYPNDKTEIIVSSDHSDDQTAKLVLEFIKNNPQKNIKLYETKSRGGKTNAQNEAVRIADNEILVFTDANSMIDPQAIRWLVMGLCQENVGYVTGKLVYLNRDQVMTSESESTYWDIDVRIRSIESRIQTITAGNGALYACWKNEYVEIPNIESHDSTFPRHFALKGKRAVSIDEALVYEKAGETNQDEFKRKVRMNRIILKGILPDYRIFNVFKYKWYSFFYFGHRTCRYTLWLNHLILLTTNFLLVNEGYIYNSLFVGQLIFYILANVLLRKPCSNKYFNMMAYYMMTIYAQITGVYKSLTNNNKAYWEKAETTR
ncbi:glycosyltransferase [Enterococcus sp. AZ162]|uniref:glycosyltransferase n=1 Tax=unclassified Enterococcus TaxID=2608891 RepID=UPI003F259CF8